MDFTIHNLDLSKYVRSKDAFGQSHVYELYAISNHYGGLGGGHYTAYAKVCTNGAFYVFSFFPLGKTAISLVGMEVKES